MEKYLTKIHILDAISDGNNFFIYGIRVVFNSFIFYNIGFKRYNLQTVTTYYSAGFKL